MPDYDSVLEDAEKLLVSFHQKVSGTIDCAYVLKGGLDVKDVVEAHLKGRNNEIHYDPHAADDRQRITYGTLNPGNVLLIADDSYEHGGSFRRAVLFFQREGYELDKIYGFYLFGGLGAAIPKEKRLPVLDTAQNFLERILPHR